MSKSHKCTDCFYTITCLFSKLIKSTSFDQLCKFKRTLIVNSSIAKRKGHNKTDWGDKTAGTLKKKNIIPFFCIPLMQNKMNICEPLYVCTYPFLFTLHKNGHLSAKDNIRSIMDHDKQAFFKISFENRAIFEFL